METHDILRVLRARYGGVEASDVLVQFARIELERPDALAWMQNGKPNNMARNNLKYLRIDVQKREAMRAAWNRPVVWPAILIALLVIASAVPAFLAYRRRERMAAKPA